MVGEGSCKFHDMSPGHALSSGHEPPESQVLSRITQHPGKVAGVGGEQTLTLYTSGLLSSLVSRPGFTKGELMNWGWRTYLNRVWVQ
jgi:hypothetical protein